MLLESLFFGGTWEIVYDELNKRQSIAIPVICLSNFSNNLLTSLIMSYAQKTRTFVEKVEETFTGYFIQEPVMKIK